MYTILVVDDEEELRRAIIKRIDWEGIGFHVVGEAENGIDALELTQDFKPDLLLTDIRMPFLSGLELARQVREICPATQIAFLSGYDDFTYAQEAIEYNIISYILKPLTMAQLTHELIKIREKLDYIFGEFKKKHEQMQDLSGFLIPLILDAYSYGARSEEELLMKAEACGAIRSAKNPPFYVVMTTMFLDEKNKSRTDCEHAHALDLIVRKYIRGFHFYSNGKIISFLPATKAVLNKYLHILSGEITQDANRILNFNVKIGVSRIMERLKDCHEAYCEAMDALRSGTDAQNSILYIEDEVGDAGEALDRLMRMVSDIEEYVRTCDSQGLKDYFVSAYLKLRGVDYTVDMIRLVLLQLFSSVFRILYTLVEAGEMVGIQEKYPLHRIATFSGSMREAMNEGMSFCLAGIELISDQRKQKGKSICDKAIMYINKNFMDPDLSLVGLSGELGISPNYLSALMKKNQDMSFIELLTSRRMEAARKLVLMTSYKICDIAQRCGYRDQHYFSYCFKKYTGYSPNALRRKMKEGDKT